MQHLKPQSRISGRNALTKPIKDPYFQTLTFTAVISFIILLYPSTSSYIIINVFANISGTSKDEKLAQKPQTNTHSSPPTQFPPSPIEKTGWLVGWLVGWLSGWLGHVLLIKVRTLAIKCTILACTLCASDADPNAGSNVVGDRPMRARNRSSDRMATALISSVTT